MAWILFLLTLFFGQAYAGSTFSREEKSDIKALEKNRDHLIDEARKALERGDFREMIENHDKAVDVQYDIMNIYLTKDPKNIFKLFKTSKKYLKLHDINAEARVRLGMPPKTPMNAENLTWEKKPAQWVPVKKEGLPNSPGSVGSNASTVGSEEDLDHEGSQSGVGEKQH